MKKQLFSLVCLLLCVTACQKKRRCCQKETICYEETRVSGPEGWGLDDVLENEK